MAVAVPNLNLQMIQDQKTVLAVAGSQEINGEKFENVLSKVKERTSQENNAVQSNLNKKEKSSTKPTDPKTDDEKVKEASSSVLFDVPGVQSDIPAIDTAINTAITEAENINNTVSNQLQNDLIPLMQAVKPEELNVATEVDNSFQMANEQFEEVAQDLTTKIQETVTPKETSQPTAIETKDIEEISVSNVEIPKTETIDNLSEPKLDKQDMFEQLEIDPQSEENTTSNNDFEQGENNNTPNENKNSTNEVDFLKEQDTNVIYTKVTESLDIQPATKTTTTEQIETNVVKQIDEGLQDLSLNNPKVNIVLRPENLGKVKIELQNGNEGLVAKFAVSSSEVKEIFDKNLESLKNTLSSQGVNVDNIVVKLEASANADNNYLNFQNDQFRQQEFSNPHRQNAYKQEMENGKNQIEYENNEIDNNEEQILLNEDVNRNELGRIDYRV